MSGSTARAAVTAEYAERLAARRARAGALARLERRIGTARLLVFAVAVALGWLSGIAGAVSPWWLAAPAAAFAGLVLAHARVIPARHRADRAVQYYVRGTARLDDEWMGGGTSGERFADPQHPYSADLDLFGRGSLFELLCTARTSVGEDTLARWLCAPADRGEIAARHAAVAELREARDFREQLAIAGAEIGGRLHVDALRAWGAAPPIGGLRRRRALPFATVAAAGSAALLWALGRTGPAPLLALLVIEAIVARTLRPRVRAVLRGVELPGRDLGLLVELLAHIEAARFAAPRLTALRAALDTAGVPPSRRIVQLQRLVNLLDARRNQLFAAVAPLLLWTTQLALAIEAWRAQAGGAIARWVEAVGEVEALSALATYAFEQPDDRFPELVADGPRFDAAAIGHPLLPRARCVRNDVSLAGDPAVLVVSGSNMSGKSTLLRTVGVNAVLAQAGAPVRAARLVLSPLAIGTSMRIADSLQAGTSRFYAEIQRLRALVDLAAGPSPLLFLLDEILHGTNSHDRRLGAEAIVRGLLARGAIGLVTTHDLSLASIADALAPRVANVHFEDHLEHGRMTFDYRMRPGVVRKSNALELMRAVGLEV
jgi:hypothetical protein